MMTKLSKLISAALMITIIALIFNCAGEDGEPGPAGPAGPAGPTGATGAAGAAGANGINGLNGIGFDESVSLGNIVINLEGKRPDNNADFTFSKDFKFAPSQLNYSANYPFATSDYFEIARFTSTVDDVYQENYVYLEFEVENSGATPVFTFYVFGLRTFVTTSDFKFFEIDYDDYASYADASITEYSYIPATGSLKFKFDFTVLAINNSTGSDLRVFGEADVIVYEDID